MEEKTDIRTVILIFVFCLALVAGIVWVFLGQAIIGACPECQSWINGIGIVILLVLGIIPLS